MELEGVLRIDADLCIVLRCLTAQCVEQAFSTEGENNEPEEEEEEQGVNDHTRTRHSSTVR